MFSRFITTLAMIAALSAPAFAQSVSDFHAGMTRQQVIDIFSRQPDAELTGMGGSGKRVHVLTFLVKDGPDGSTISIGFDPDTDIIVANKAGDYAMRILNANLPKPPELVRVPAGTPVSAAESSLDLDGSKLAAKENARLEKEDADRKAHLDDAHNKFANERKNPNFCQVLSKSNFKIGMTRQQIKDKIPFMPDFEGVQGVTINPENNGDRYTCTDRHHTYYDYTYDVQSPTAWTLELEFNPAGQLVEIPNLKKNGILQYAPKSNYPQP